MILAMFAILAGTTIVAATGFSVISSAIAQTTMDNATMAGNMTSGNMTADNATGSISKKFG